MSTHRIHQLRCFVQAPSKESAFAQRQLLRSELDSTLLPAIERAFDGFASGADVIRIPRLEVHVRWSEGEHSAAQLADVIQEQFDLALRSAVGQAAIAPKRDIRGEHGDRASVDGPFETSVATFAEHGRELLLEYLRCGQIGWQAKSPAITEIVDWLREAAEQLANEQSDLSPILAGDFDVRFMIGFRWLQLLSSQAWASLLQRLPISGHDSPQKLLFQLTSVTGLKPHTKLKVVATLLALRVEDPLSVIQDHLKSIVAECFEELNDDSHAGSGMTQSLRQACDEFLGHDIHRDPLDQSKIPSSDLGPWSVSQVKPDLSTLVPGPIENEVEALPDDVAWRLSVLQPSAETHEPGLLADDAGMILLHPFLRGLFENINLIEPGGRILSESILPRAGAVLHWLLTGREDVFEFELTLIKVLLGLQPNDPLPVSNGLLTVDERTEADAMLAAVIEHWAAIGKTSAAGLRASFLQRRGMLHPTDQGWRLRVETRSFDMLLGHLPWGISIVKLPWMKKPIFADWPTP